MNGLQSAALLGAITVLCGCTRSDGYRDAVTNEPVPVQALAPAPSTGPGSELAGAVVQVASVNGGLINEVHFRTDGTALIIPPDRRVSINGRWSVRDERLCVDWQPRGNECWPYRTALVVGQPVNLTSDRGHTVRVTLMSNSLPGS